MSEKNSFLMYKGKPLVRDGNDVYYGFPFEPYVAMLHIINSEEDKELDFSISTRVKVMMMSTDESKELQERVIKNTEKQGLFEALNIANIWLDQELRAKS